MPAALPPHAPPARAQLAWRCRRGMKELDLLLRRWLDQHYDAADETQRAAFASLLELPDPQLARFLLGYERPPQQAQAALVDALTGECADRQVPGRR